MGQGGGANQAGVERLAERKIAQAEIGGQFGRVLALEELNNAAGGVIDAKIKGLALPGDEG